MHLSLIHSRAIGPLLAFVVLFVVPACTTCETEATPGFFTVGTLGEPRWMTRYSTGVFKLRTEVLERADDEARVPGLAPASRGVVRRHYCTAFLFGDARTLWTNRHGFPYLQQGDEWRFPQLAPGQELEFVLEDHDGRVVFDTRRMHDRARVVFAGAESWIRMADGAAPPRVVQASASDFVRIRLSRPLDGHVFEDAGRDPSPGEQIYALGWPSPTSTREPAFGEPDSDGQSLRFTAGVVTEHVPFDIVDWKERTERFDAASFRETMFLTTADCELGMSGSPIVDANGEVLGILSISFARRACPSSRQASGILWRQIERLQTAHHRPD